MTWLVALLPTDGDHLRRSLVMVALLGVLSKLALGMLVFSSNPQGIFESSDSHEYHQLALNILRHGSFSQSLSPPLEPETIRTPAYPFLLSGLYHVAGIRPHAMVAIQIALSVVTMLAGCRIASLLFGSRAGLLTAIFLALDPVSLYYSQVMLTETLFGAALTLSLLGMLYAVRHPSIRYPCWAGFCLALATYTRPTGYYLGMLLPVMLFLAIRRSKGWRPAFASAALMWLLFAAMVGGWQLRNYVSTGSAQFSQAKNQYLFVAKAAAIIAMRDDISLQEAQQRLAQEHAALYPPDLPRPSPTQLLESQGRFAQAVVAAHPVLLVLTTLQGTAANLMGPSNLAHLFGSDNVALREAFLRQDFARFPLRAWITALSSWTSGLLFLGVLYTGVWILLKHKGIGNGDIAVLVLTAAYVILVSSGPEAYSRFRMPVMPIFCILAAGGYLCRVESRFGEQLAPFPYLREV
jgi:4-amino-4-deoxy-L-arabinose transferase-like glycosyltransferase